AFQEHVALRKDSHQSVGQQLIVAHDGFLNFRLHPREQRAEGGEFLTEFEGRFQNRGKGIEATRPQETVAPLSEHRLRPLATAKCREFPHLKGRRLTKAGARSPIRHPLPTRPRRLPMSSLDHTLGQSELPSSADAPRRLSWSG